MDLSLSHAFAKFQVTLVIVAEWLPFGVIYIIYIANMKMERSAHTQGE